MIVNGRMMVTRFIAFAVLLALTLLSAAGSARAAEGASDWFVTDQGRVRLIAAFPRTGGDETVQLGLEFRLAPHWKIYWRSPGDAGFPPHLDWTGSRNLGNAAIAWPAPQRFSVQGLETVGYADEVVLPITARLERPGEAVHLQAALNYLTCREICIPYETTLSLDLPAGSAPAASSGTAALIARYAERVPGDGSAAGLALIAATITPGQAPTLDLRLRATPALAAPDAFIEGGGDVAFAAPIPVSAAPGEALLRLKLFGDRAAIDALVGGKLTVTLVDGDRALEATAVPVMGRPATDLGGFWRILALALLGGLILNAMPCVLPVLSIKLLGVVSQGGASRRALRLGFLASAAGVVLSFLALAGVMIAFKSAGLAVGWGVQFQQPLFLTGMVVLLTLFAANLWGLFEVPLPQFFAGLATAGAGRAVLGNLAAGAFATLLATPCSAPFLGTAVGVALAAGPLEILTIFLALGLGMAAPYLLVAAVPALVRWLPRPGRWMIGLRRVLSLALAATALWLIAVLMGEVGPWAALAVLLAMAATVAGLALLRAPALRRGTVIATLAVAFILPAGLSAPPTIAESDAFWHAFDPQAIPELVRQGHIVFVDVTADWCVTCQVNKRLVLDSAAVRERLHAPDIIAMRADWTRPSDAIAAYLKGFGRYGIPFNAVYGRGTPEGLPLSEILTADQVNAALHRAGGG